MTMTSSDERARAARYSRLREALALVEMFWGWLVSAAVLASGGSAALRGAGGWAARPWLSDVRYGLLMGLLTRAAHLPFAYLRGYTIEHQFGLSTQDRGGWAVDQVKAAALGLAFEVPITAASYAVIRRSPRWWWLILSAAALPFTVLLVQLYPRVIAPIFNRFEPIGDPELANRVKALAARAGVPVAEVVRMDMSRRTRKANAFFAGMGPTRRIALGDTLMDELTPEEIEVIVAHELAHQVHGDVWKGVVLGSAATLGTAFLTARVAPSLLARFGSRIGVSRLDDVASAPLLGLLAGVISALAGPLANAYSRRAIERPADRYALDLTGRPDAFIGAMEKLVRLNLIDPEPPRLVELLLHSHPAIRDRIAAARAWAGASPGPISAGR